jgi:hypothetical protein
VNDLLREYIQRILIEDANVQGCRYEASVIKSLKIAGAAGHLKRAACSDATRPDADIRVDGDVFYVEVKASDRAQMGGGSLGYSVPDREFFPTGQNRELSETLTEFLNDINDSSLHKGIANLLAFLSKKSKKHLDKIPVSGFSPEAWAQAVQKGLVQPVNRTLESHIDVVAAHYAHKNTFYIQIGGAGFFRLGEANPANLPVPKLEGKVVMEVRVAKAGDMGDVSKAGLRVQARLSARNASPYTLDDPDSVKQMLADR